MLNYNVLKNAKQEFIVASTRAYTRGIQTGSGGNISVRVPNENLMVVKPSKLSLIDCNEENLVVTDFDGNVVEGDRKPTRESLLHGALYKNLPNVNGVVHCHSPWSITWSFTKQDLPLLTMHSQLKIGIPIPVFFHASPKAVMPEEIPSILDFFKKKADLPAFILGAHGIVAVGSDVIDAENTAELIEETAQIAYLHAIGQKIGIIPG